jgi:D-alanyl-D-alanine carboxypeptidase
MRIYAKALATGQLLDAAGQQQRLDSIKPVAAADGPGYGLAIASFGPLVGHTGSLPGFQTFVGADPKTGTTVVVLTNLQFSPDGTETANAITMALLPHVLTAPADVDGTDPQGQG